MRAMVTTWCVGAALMWGASLPGNAGPQAADEAVIEPATKIEFAPRLQAPGTEAGELVLTGTGVRTWGVWPVKWNIYAFGLYVREQAARVSLRAWRGKNLENLHRDDTLYEALLEDDFDKSLRLVLNRNIGGDDVAEAFTESLEPRFERAAEVAGGSFDANTLARFRALFGDYFGAQELTKGAELVFVWLRGGTMVTAVNGEVIGIIESRTLCWAFFDIYLGEDPISREGKETVISRLPELLQEK